MAIGRVGSFATDRPLEDAIGPAIKYNEQMGFKYREEAEKKFKEISEAYQIIGDPDKRREYDIANSEPMFKVRSVPQHQHNFSNQNDIFKPE